MKKLALTLAIVLTMGLGAMAQDGGLLNRGVSFDKQENAQGGLMNFPEHGQNIDGNATSGLGSGVVMLLGLGAAYMVAKKRKED